MENGTFDFTNKKSSIKSPLAFKIFSIKGVSWVFYGNNYISIGKEDDLDWEELKPQIYDQIENFFESDQLLFKEEI